MNYKIYKPLRGDRHKQTRENTNIQYGNNSYDGYIDDQIDFLDRFNKYAATPVVDPGTISWLTPRKPSTNRPRPNQKIFNSGSDNKFGAEKYSINKGNRYNINYVGPISFL